MSERYVVNGINNDKIEFVDNYSVRAFNRYTKYLKTKAKVEAREELLQTLDEDAKIREKLNQTLEEIKAEIDDLELWEKEDYHTGETLADDLIRQAEVFEIIDKHISKERNGE